MKSRNGTACHFSSTEKPKVPQDVGHTLKERSNIYSCLHNCAWLQVRHIGLSTFHQPILLTSIWNLFVQAPKDSVQPEEVPSVTTGSYFLQAYLKPLTLRTFRDTLKASPSGY